MGTTEKLENLTSDNGNFPVQATFSDELVNSSQPMTETSTKDKNTKNKKTKNKTEVWIQQTNE